MRRRLVLLILAVSMLAGQFLLFAGVAAAAEIDSNGPLTQILITPDLACQVAHVGDEAFELYGGEVGSCGTFLAIGGTVFGPSGGYSTNVPYTPQAQAPISGSGSARNCGRWSARRRGPNGCCRDWSAN